MASTTNGLPYPVGTDKVVDGDNQIRALAEAVDTAVLPHGYVRARCTTSASHGASAWNIANLDVLADAHGAQPWVLEAASRRVKVTAAGVYGLTAVLTMGGVLAVAVAISADGTTWDRITVAPVGSTAFTNSTTTFRYLAANTYVALMMYAPATQNTTADAVGSPSYLAVQALGGQ
jgi:hypothetical protein